MKRTEMLKILSHELYLANDCAEPVHIYDLQAEHILSTLEKAGMEPPYTGNGFTQGNYWETESAPVKKSTIPEHICESHSTYCHNDYYCDICGKSCNG